MTKREREAVAATSLNVAVAFINFMGRAPDQRECDLLVRSVLEYFDHRDGPGSTLTLQ